MAENVELSERELEILKLVATGASNKEIAQQLYISANTVKVHLRNIFAKINATTRTEAAMYAVHLGLVQTTPALENIETSEPEGEAELADGPYPTSQVIPDQHELVGRRRYAAWVVLVILLVLTLVGVWVATARGPAGTAFTTGSTPAVGARWQPKARLPEPSAGLAVAAFDNAIYAIGGENPEGVLASLYRYDPVQDSLGAAR